MQNHAAMRPVTRVYLMLPRAGVKGGNLAGKEFPLSVPVDLDRVADQGRGIDIEQGTVDDLAGSSMGSPVDAFEL